MSDAIDRVRAYLDAVADTGQEVGRIDHCFNGDREGTLTFADLRELLAIAVARGWRMPDERNTYITDDDERYEYNNGWNDCLREFASLNHGWQPLPPPPQESDERTPRAVD